MQSHLTITCLNVIARHITVCVCLTVKIRMIEDCGNSFFPTESTDHSIPCIIDAWTRGQALLGLLNVVLPPDASCLKASKRSERCCQRNASERFTLEREVQLDFLAVPSREDQRVAARVHCLAPIRRHQRKRLSVKWRECNSRHLARGHRHTLEVDKASQRNCAVPRRT